MKKRDKDASELDRLFFGALALCTAVGLGAVFWHIRVPNLTGEYLGSEDFRKDFGDRVKRLTGLEITYGKVTSGGGLGFAFEDVRVTSTGDAGALNCKIEKVSGELGRDLKFADVKRLRVTRPHCEMTVGADLRPTWRPVTVGVGPRDLGLLLGARLRSVSLEDADFKMIQKVGATTRDAIRIAHVDLEGDADIDVNGFNANVELRGTPTSRLTAALQGGAAELGLEGWIRANLPRSGDLRLTADSKITATPGNQQLLGAQALPLQLGLDAVLKGDGKMRFDRFQVANAQFQTVLKGLAIPSAAGDRVAAKFSTQAMTYKHDDANTYVVRDANVSIDVAMKGGGLDVNTRFLGDEVKSPGGVTWARMVDFESDVGLRGGGIVDVRKLKVAVGANQTLVAVVGKIDGSRSPATVELSGDFRQALAPFDFGATNVKGTVDGSIRIKSNDKGGLAAEGVAKVDIAEARHLNTVISDATAEVPFRFLVDRPMELARWLEAANPDQLLDRYFKTTTAFDVTTRGTIGMVRVMPDANSKDTDVTMRGVTLDATYRLVPETGRTELWGKSTVAAVEAPTMDGSAIRDLKLRLESGFAYHQDNGGSVDVAVDFFDKRGLLAPTRADATVKTRGSELIVGYRANGPLFAMLAQTVGLDFLVRTKGASFTGELRFPRLMNPIDLRSWAFLPFNFPYQGEVSGNGRFDLTGIDYGYLEGVRNVHFENLSGNFSHSDGAIGHKVQVAADSVKAALTLDNGTTYQAQTVKVDLDGSFTTPLPSVRAPFQVSFRANELANLKTGKTWPHLTASAAVNVQRAQSVRISSLDVGLNGSTLVTGSGSVGGLYPLRNVDLWADFRLDTTKFEGLTDLSSTLGEVRIPLRLSSSSAEKLKLVGSILRQGNGKENQVAPSLVPINVEWKVGTNNEVHPKVSFEEVVPRTYFKTSH